MDRTRYAPDEAWRLGFANMVLAFTELPDGRTRLGRGIKHPLTLADLRTSVDSVWKDVPVANRPERVLRAVPAGEAGTESVVSLTYVVPVTDDFAATRASLLRSADSLVRVRRMILDPATQLEGRRNPVGGTGTRSVDERSRSCAFLRRKPALLLGAPQDLRSPSIRGELDLVEKGFQRSRLIRVPAPVEV